MMTIHSAKGLEFPIVFLPGMEDGIFPGMQTIEGGESEMEEERRLAYVAITRAKRELYILHADQRLLYGRTGYNPLSRFVSEIPSSLIEEEKTQRAGVWGRVQSQGTYGSFGAKSPVSQKKTYYREQDSRSAGNSPNGAKPGSGAVRVAVGASAPTRTVAPSRPAATPARQAPVFAPGDRVEHMVFGAGEVISCKKMGTDILYEVIFEKVGTKKLMGSFAKMKKV